VSTYTIIASITIIIVLGVCLSPWGREKT